MANKSKKFAAGFSYFWKVAIALLLKSPIIPTGLLLGLVILPKGLL
ncbi:hypothetical protein [Nostoc sp. FACHB-110]|nr:hypothetical protein [Nostoc sp. FACHB-110]MBD2441310.1 hypothetical protein [Nostoc sp. FACHB-110]